MGTIVANEREKFIAFQTTQRFEYQLTVFTVAPASSLILCCKLTNNPSVYIFNSDF